MKKPSSTISNPKYRPDIDGLRAVAVLAVVFFHAFPASIKGGFIGVDIFFVISGFLISGIIFESLSRGAFDLKNFYIRRVRRIFPSLLVVLTTCLVFGWFFLLASELNQLGKHVAAGSAFVSNIVLWREVGYFDNASETKPLLHLWSLGVEEQFYIIWPILLVVAWKCRVGFAGITICIAFASFALNFGTIARHPQFNFYLPASRFWELLCGALLACFDHWRKIRMTLDIAESMPNPASRFLEGEQKWRWKINKDLMSVSGLLLLYIGFSTIDNKRVFPGAWALLPIGGSALIILSGAAAWVNRVVLSNRIAIWIGVISFPLYLWHWPILSFGRILFNDAPPLWFRVFAILISAALAWLTFRFVERPFRSSDSNIGRNAILLCIAMLSIGVSGILFSGKDFTHSHTIKKISKYRRGLEHGVGYSLDWYRGKGDWLFPGNRFNDSVAKLKLAVVPTESQIKDWEQFFSKAALVCRRFDARFVLFIGPDKTSIYPEYLPDELVPSEKRYSSFFLERLKLIQNLTVYDPTNELISAKEKEGLLYYMTDTHWNKKGAFVAYSGLLRFLGLPLLDMSFVNGPARPGDLTKFAEIRDLEFHPEDNWEIVWKHPSSWTEVRADNSQDTYYGATATVINRNPIAMKRVWIMGDSFSPALRDYFNATFKEVRYLGHWVDQVNQLGSELENSNEKPDIVITVMVERAL